MSNTGNDNNVGNVNSYSGSAVVVVVGGWW
jgi:hypothetical protein